MAASVSPFLDQHQNVTTPMVRLSIIRVPIAPNIGMNPANGKSS